VKATNQKRGRLTAEVVLLMVEDSLYSNDVSSISRVGANGGHNGGEDLCSKRRNPRSCTR